MPTPNDAAHERSSLARRRKLRQLLGLVVCILVVIGAGTVVSGGIHMVASLFDDTEERLEYERRLQILVAMDPVPFDSLAEASQSTLLDAAIWQAISDIDRDTVERDEVGAMYLPVLDVERAATQLYGPAFSVPRASFENRGQEYRYDEERDAFLIPITSAVADFTPKVQSIRREGSDLRRVTVGYVSLYSAGGEFSITTNEEPVKYYDYIFTRVDGTFYLSAIVASEMRAESTAATSSSSSSQSNSILDPQSALQEAVELPESSSSDTTSETTDETASDEVAPE